MSDRPVLRGDRVTLRPAEDADVPALHALLQEPGVRAWWGENTPQDVRDGLPGSYAIVVGDEVAGWLHVHEEDDADYRHVAYDISIATRFQGQGLGPEALRLAIRHHIERGHHRFQIDPSATNERAIRAYASVGFKPVGILRAYERDPAGGWRDGLLMDLLADELR
jgi:aminoglycoside 6'-N-acetyltransferase